MRNQQQHGARRRLLKRLEDSVGAEAIEFVDRIDDRHAPAAHRWSQGKEVAEPAHRIDGDLGLGFALVIDRYADDAQVRMTASCDQSADPVIGVSAQLGRRLGAEEKRCELQRQPRLADAARSAEHPAMMHLA